MVALRICVYLTLLLVFGAVWVSYFSKIDIVTHASGTVVPFGKTKTLQNLEGGIVKKINVKQGDLVRSGDVIIELEKLASKSEVEELLTRIVFLKTEIISMTSLSKSQIPNYPEEYQKNYANIVKASEENAASMAVLLNSEIEQQVSDQDNLRRSIDIMKSKIAEKQKIGKLLDQQIKISKDILSEQLTSELAHLDLLRSRQEINSEITEARQKIHTFQSRIDDNALKIQLLKNKFDNELKAKIQDYTEEEQKYSSRLQRFEDELGRREVKSPVDGTVKQLFVTTVGGVVGAGMSIAEIVPSEEKLEIEAQLLVSDIGFVSTGQEALIRLSGPNSSLFKPITARVSVISPDTVKTEGDGAAYIVRLTTNELMFNSADTRFYLYPGLLVDCSIIIGQRSVFENLIAPLIDFQNSALQENVWQSVGQVPWHEHFRNIFMPSKW